MMGLPSHLRKKPVETWSRKDWETPFNTIMKASYAHAFAEEKSLPPGFSHWDIRDRDNDTVAHVAARNGSLPDTFDQWSMTNDMGWTVAHSMAINNRHCFPEGFDQWDLGTKGGMSVLELIVSSGQSLPENFKAFDYRNSKGEDLATIATRYNNAAILAQVDADRLTRQVAVLRAPAAIRRSSHEC